MTKMPWVRFFASDWLAGTRGMSAAETGIYITLIATMYERQEPIPEDHARLARLCGASNSAFKNALELLINDEKIIRVDGGLWNNRVEKERVYLSEKSEVGSKAATARWGKKHNKNNGSQMRSQCEGNADAMPFQIPDTIIENNSIELSKKNEKTTRKKASRLPDDWEISEGLKDWIMGKGYGRDFVMREFEKFKNFWLAKSGSGATKLDWDATFRNWLLNADEKKHSSKPMTVGQAALFAQSQRRLEIVTDNGMEQQQSIAITSDRPLSIPLNATKQKPA